MSFFNFKGFGRNAKKNKNQAAQIPGTSAPSTPLYSSANSSTSKQSLRRSNSPVKQQQQQQYPTSQIQAPSNSSQSHLPQQQSYRKSQQQFEAPVAPQRSSRPQSISSQSQHEEVQTLKAIFLSEPFVRTALVKGSFKTIVQLPKYVDAGEWIALNIFEFFTNLNQFYGVIAEYVTPDAYSTMNAGPHTDYLWLDANNRQVSLPASQYIDLALTWINNKVNDKNLFPTANGLPFPSAFQKDIQRITVQMFRIFAHIYHHHFDKIVHLSLEAHWNSFFAHFISFAKEFNIIDRKEMLPLIPLIENFESQGKII